MARTKNKARKAASRALQAEKKLAKINALPPAKRQNAQRNFNREQFKQSLQNYDSRRNEK